LLSSCISSFFASLPLLPHITLFMYFLFFFSCSLASIPLPQHFAQSRPLRCLTYAPPVRQLFAGSEAGPVLVLDVAASVCAPSQRTSSPPFLRAVSVLSFPCFFFTHARFFLSLFRVALVALAAADAVRFLSHGRTCSASSSPTGAEGPTVAQCFDAEPR